VALPTLGRDDPLGPPGWRGIFAHKNELGGLWPSGRRHIFTL
jgi:hypothetical protein